jgi:hypothetical protein
MTGDAEEEGSPRVHPREDDDENEEMQQEGDDSEQIKRRRTLEGRSVPLKAKFKVITLIALTDIRPDPLYESPSRTLSHTQMQSSIQAPK